MSMYAQFFAELKPQQIRPAGEVGKRPKVDRRWQMISTDIIGPFPKSGKGHIYVLTVTDYFSKFTLYFSMRRALSSTIIKALEETVFLLLGVPEFVIYDNGEQYTSREFKSFLQQYNVKPLYNALYYFQNNPVERVNRVTKTMIASYINEDQRKWDDNLAKLSCAMRTAKHQVLKCIPYYVNFGTEMITDDKQYQEIRKIQTDLNEEEEGVRKENEIVEVDKEHSQLKKLLQYVQRNLQKAYEQAQKRYNLRRRPVQYEKGDRVWKKKYKLSDAGKYYSAKLAPKYVVPFKVKKRLRLNVCELEDEREKSVENWHVKDIKPDKLDYDKMD